jgi:hypothetical protein
MIPSSTRQGGFFAALGFFIVAGMAMALHAAGGFLPVWQRQNQAQYARNALAAQVETTDRLIDYNEKLIEAVKTDPILTQRLMSQHMNYRPPGEIAVETGAPEDPPIAVLLAAEAPLPPSPPPTLAALAEKVQNPSTRRGLLAIAGLLMTAAMILFAPPDASTKKR